MGFIRNRRWFPDSPYVDDRTISGFLTGRVTAYRKSLAGIRKYHHLVPHVMAVQLCPSTFPISYIALNKSEIRTVLKA